MLGISHLFFLQVKNCLFALNPQILIATEMPSFESPAQSPWKKEYLELIGMIRFIDQFSSWEYV